MNRGNWFWDSATNELKFKKTKTMDKFLEPNAVLTSNEDSSRLVELEDVKKVAIQFISSELVTSMYNSSVLMFDKCYNTPAMDHFLYQVLIYFHYYLKHQTVSNDEALETQGIAGDIARNELKLTVKAFEQAKSNLSASYIALIAGLDSMRFSHHSLHGKLPLSRTKRDRQLYEAIYEFTILVTWITFNYQYWDKIHSIIGRTSSFNKDMTVKSPTLEDEESSDEDDLGSFLSDSSIDSAQLSWKIQHDRPKRGLLNKIRTPIMEQLYPRYSERRKIQIPEVNFASCAIGIIGQPIAKFDTKTLKPLEAEDESTTSITSTSEIDSCSIADH